MAKKTKKIDRIIPPVKELTVPIAAPGGMLSVRQTWREETGDLTPQYLAAILRSALDGDARAFLTLAEEMEERELHYRSVLDTRKRAVSGLKPKIDPVSDNQEDIDLANDLRALVKRPGFRTLVKSCMDAIGKGYSVSEIIWQRGKDKWLPDFKWRDPRFFVYGLDTREELRLIDERDALNGIPLPQFKFVVHQPVLKSGVRIRGGIAYAAAFAYMCKSFTAFDWMSFADVYGMPLRLGRYGPNANDVDIAILRNAVANIGSDAAAVLPDSMRIEFQETANQAGHNEFFDRLATFWDNQISKLVLGQTRTADEKSAGLNKSSEADGKDTVRADIQIDDTEELNETLNRDVIIPYVILNYGARDVYPVLEMAIPERRDVPVLMDSLSKLVPLGLKVQQSEIRDILNLTDPDEDAELLGLTPPPPTETARNSAQTARNATADTADLFAEQLAERMRPVLAKMAAPIQQLVENASSFEEIADKLYALYPEMDATAFTELLTSALLAAELAGRADVETGA